MTVDAFCQQIIAGQGAEALREYLAAGGDVNAIDPRSGSPLLHLACEHENLVMIQELVRSGANVDVRDSFGQAALHVAVDIDIDAVVQAGGQTSDMTFAVTRRMLELGANPDVRDNGGRLPRDLAAAYGSAVLAKFDRQTRL